MARIAAEVAAVRLEDDVPAAAGDARDAVEAAQRDGRLDDALGLDLREKDLVVPVAVATSCRVELRLALGLPGEVLSALADLDALVRVRSGARAAAPRNNVVDLCSGGVGCACGIDSLPSLHSRPGSRAAGLVSAFSSLKIRERILRPAILRLVCESN